MLCLMQPRQNDQRLVRGSQFRLRMLTSPLRALPNFFVLGAMKSGTSSLFDYVCQHPGVAPPFRKETHYLTLGVREGLSLDWYRAHFPIRMKLANKMTGEATPDYLFETPALERLKRLRPAAKLMVLFRDPVERAISQYQHEVRMGRETMSLEDALAHEDERIAFAEKMGPAGSETVLHATYKRRGQYAEQLERLFKYFPRDQVLVLWNADLFARPRETMVRVFEFLGLPAATKSLNFEVKNAATQEFRASPNVVEALQAHYRPHDARLAELLSQPVPWSSLP